MYEKRLGDAGYISVKLARTNNRGDGVFSFYFLNTIDCTPTLFCQPPPLERPLCSLKI